MGTIWWFFLTFFYMKNQTNDDNLQTMNGMDTLPIGWFWERMVETNGTNGWIAASLFFGWWSYLMISVVELAAWITYEFGSIGFAEYYFSTFGYWGSILLYAIPWLLDAIHIGVYGVDNMPGSWSVFLLAINAVLWIVIGLLHIIYIDEFMAYVDAQRPTSCACSLPPVPPLPENPTAKYVEVRLMALAERESLCALECPSGEGKAPPAAPAAAVMEDDADSSEKGEGWI